MEVNVNYKGRPMFLGGDVSISRFDTVTYPMIEKFTETELGFYWRPEEIQDILRDKNDFDSLSPHEQHIFSSNLLRQILLDSIQGSEPTAVLGPCSSVPEVENWIQTWTFFETIHSRSYTHIIRNVYPSPDKIFEMIPQVRQIIDCAEDISRYYDDLDWYNKAVSLNGYGAIVNNEELTLYKHKTLLYKCLCSVNILEAIRFFTSFSCTFSFAERKLMEGTAKIVKLILRDESIHVSSTQYMLKELRRKDEDFAKIFLETQDECGAMFRSAIKQEKDWAKYLFKDGSMLGLTENILCQYIDYISKHRMKAIDLPCDDITINQNPLPWMNKWMSSKEVQDAAQEVNQVSYKVGAVKSDLSKDMLSKIKL